MTGLADCNNFFVSCERSVNPDLCDRAVVVLSNNDGCVVARSNESKRLGIRMGQPAFEIRELVESGKVIALSGNHLLYRDISLRVHDIFRRFVPDCVDYSVDESFLDVKGIPVDYLQCIGEEIHRVCRLEAGIPVTIGFAPTKTLAKVITEVTKKRGENVGIFRSVDDAMPILRKMPVSETWGVGRRIAKRLYQEGVYTMADLARRDGRWIRAKFGVTGERTWLELNGKSCIELDHVNRPLQDSVSETRTFPEDVDDYDYLRARMVIYASDCAKKLRAMHGVCRGVGVFLRTNPFHPERGNCRPEGMVRLDHPTSVTTTITNAALNVLDSIFIPGVPFKRGGVWLADITPDLPVTPSLFEGVDRKEALMRKFMRTVDHINISSGTTFGLASRIVKVQRGHNDGYSSSFQAPRRLEEE